MRSTWWAAFLGTGAAALSASLGACGGYSSLGEVPGAGGEAGTEDGAGGSMSTGAKGGQSHGGTNGMGASPGMGGTGMGAVGGTGMGATGGTGMGAVGGTEMGMGAVGGGSEPTRCMTDADCPPPPPYCNMCVDGTSECIHSVCNGGECGLVEPACPNEPNGCVTDADCPQLPCVAGAACPVSICITGTCAAVPSSDAPCTSRVCGDPCMRPDGTSGTCDAVRACVDDVPDCTVLDFSRVFCDPSLDNKATMEPASADFLKSSCAKNFCHGKNFVANLDLTPDSGFAQRLLDRPGSFGDITCADLSVCVPDACPAPGTVKLVDSANPMASWLLTKSNGGSMGCGDIMPDGNGLTGAKFACLTAIVNATATLSP